MNTENRNYEISEKPQAIYGAVEPGAGVAASETPSADGGEKYFQRIFESWRKILFAGALAGAVALGVVVAARFLFPSPVTYSNAIVVTMGGVEKGVYPNGAPYSPTDLRSAPVLESVYATNQIEKYGISLSVFQGYVSVESYSPSYSFLVERYRERLSNRTLTFEEKKSIEEEFRAAEASLKSSGLIVNLTLPENSSLPETIARKVVVDIPAKWAEVFVERFGVAKLPLFASGSDLVNQELAKRLDFPLAYDYLDGLAGTLRSSIASAFEVPGASTYVSESTGKSLSDLSRDLDSIYRYRIQLGLKPLIDKGLSKDPATTSLIYENAIANLDRDANAQSGYAENIQSILGSFRNGVSSGNNPSEGGTSSITTQIDGAFVDKIVALTSSKEGLEFEKELQREKLQRQNDKVSIVEQRGRYADRLSAIRAGMTQGSGPVNLEKIFVEDFAAAVNDLNSIWKQTTEIASEFGASKLNADKSLYRLSDLPDSRKVAKPPLLHNMALLSVLGSVLLFTILATALFAFGPDIGRKSVGGRNRHVGEL